MSSFDPKGKVLFSFGEQKKNLEILDLILRVWEERKKAWSLDLLHSDSRRSPKKIKFGFITLLVSFSAASKVCVPAICLTLNERHLF